MKFSIIICLFLITTIFFLACKKEVADDNSVKFELIVDKEHDLSIRIPSQCEVTLESKNEEGKTFHLIAKWTFVEKIPVVPVHIFLVSRDEFPLTIQQMYELSQKKLVPSVSSELHYNSEKNLFLKDINLKNDITNISYYFKRNNALYTIQCQVSAVDQKEYEKHFDTVAYSLKFNHQEEKSSN